MTAQRVPTVTHLVVTDLFAGVERYVTTVATATAARGWRVRVLGGRELEMRAWLTDDVTWEPASSLRSALRGLARARDDDVWHLHMTAADLVAGVLPHGPKRVSTRHFAAPRGRTSLNRLAGRIAAGRIDVEIAISETVRRATGVHDMPVLLNPVPDNDREREPGRTVAVVQRLEREKRTGEAVAVFAASGLAEDGWTMEIHGEGSDRPAVEQAISDHRLTSSVRLAGWTQDMATVYAGAGVLLATAPHEPLGLAVAEAMAASTPVVATASGGHTETLGAVDEPGVDSMYPPGDVQAGGRILRRVALDPRREEAGTRLRAWQREHLGVDRHVDALLALYDDRLKDSL